MARRSKPGSRIQRLPTRTKIVATLGPASSDLDDVRQLIQSGVDVFRLNFSHGTHAGHGKAIRQVKKASRLEGRPVAVLADLQGPKIRLGRFAGSTPFLVQRGGSLTIVADPDLEGVPGRVGCSYRNLAKEMHPGERILLDDGAIELVVTSVEGREVTTRVRHGGLLRQLKGVNLPGTKVRAPSLGKKDLVDLEFAIELDVDFVALSFVRTSSEVRSLRRKIAGLGGSAEVIAKIERPEAIQNISSIVEEADGIMIARGDMGVEVGPEKVPAIQKRLIKLCIAAAKPVITATQMLESMIESPRPTRAEASDVANAIHDGTSALMLSAETASGKYPVTTVKMMDRIARRTEADILDGRGHPARRRLTDAVGPPATRGNSSVTEATVAAASLAAMDVGAKVIVAFTETGNTAKHLARERLSQRLVAFTPDERTLRRLTLQWGINPLIMPRARSLVELRRSAVQSLLDHDYVVPGDRAVFIAGSLQVSGATNTMVILEIPARP